HHCGLGRRSLSHPSWWRTSSRSPRAGPTIRSVPIMPYGHTRGQVSRRTSMGHAYLIDGMRTPIGRYGGALSSVRPDDLAAHVIGALVEKYSDVEWSAVDDVVLGCANQAGEDNRNVARM